MALVRANPLPLQPSQTEPQVEHDYKHLKEVTARLVWARPPFADQPLWNAAECRGKVLLACNRTVTDM